MLESWQDWQKSNKGWLCWQVLSQQNVKYVQLYPSLLFKDVGLIDVVVVVVVIVVVVDGGGGIDVVVILFVLVIDAVVVVFIVIIAFFFFFLLFLLLLLLLGVKKSMIRFLFCNSCNKLMMSTSLYLMLCLF